MQQQKKDFYIGLVLVTTMVCVSVWCAYTWHGEIYALLQRSVSPSSYYQVLRGDYYLIVLGIVTGIAVYCLLISIHLFSSSDTLPESLPVQSRKLWDRLVAFHFIIALILGIASAIGIHAWINNTNNIVASQLSGVDWDVVLGHTLSFFLSCGGLGWFLALFYCCHVSEKYQRRIISKANAVR